MKLDINKKILIPTVSVCLLLMGASVFTTLYKNTSTEPTNKLDEQTMSIKLLNVTNNNDGSVTQTFSYFITPSNASVKTVSIKAYFKSGADCTSYVIVTSNSANQTINVTVKRPFSEQVIVTISPTDNPSISKQLLVDYEKKLLSISDLSDYIQLGGDTPSAEGVEHHLNEWTVLDEASYLFKGNYSLYSLDKQYTYSVNYLSYEVDQVYTRSTYQDEWIDVLGNYLFTTLKNHGKVSKEDIWNLIDSNQYHSWLADNATEGSSVGFDIEYEVTCNEDPSKTLSASTYAFLGLDYDFSKFKINVEDMQLEYPNLIF